MLIKSDGKALRRPVLSPDGKTLAVISADERIHLISLSEAARGHRYINGVKITRSIRPFLQTCQILRWSPEMVYTHDDEAVEVLSNTTSECDLGRSWLLLSDGRRVIAISTELRTPKMMPTADEETGVKSNVLADYDLGQQMGKIGLVDFVFDHRHALVIFEIGSSAAILSLCRPQRDDIPHVKFPDGRSLARAPDSRYFALLRREKGQDKITVFELGIGKEVTYKSFDCITSDAQDIAWCPTGQPLLAVWDSPSYGVKVSFVTAQGHALSQFDIGLPALQRGLNKVFPDEVERVDLTFWSWRDAKLNTSTLTVEVLATGQKQVLVRYQPTNSMEARLLAHLTHPAVIDGAKSFVWQESNSIIADRSATSFTRQTGTFEVVETSSGSKLKNQCNSQSRSHPQDTDQVDIIELNSTHTVVATHISSSPRKLLLWRTSNTVHPHTVLIFSHAIRQIHFHPFLPQVLIVITSSKNARVYAWYQHNSPPISGLIPIDVSRSINFCMRWLPECVSRNDTRQVTGESNITAQRVPILFTSNAAFEAGYLSSQDNKIVFESILHRTSQSPGDLSMGLAGEDSTSEIIDTPSRASKQKPGENVNGVTKKARFDVPDTLDNVWREDPIHEQAGYGYAW